MQKGVMTKERIVRAAAKLFAQNGYHATGLTELEEAVGMGRGNLYYHIGSKENLLYEISIQHVEQMVAFGEQLLLERLTPEERFRRLSRELMRVIVDNLDELTVFFREVTSLTGERNEKIRQLRARFEEIWLTILRDGEKEGLFERVDPLTVKAVLGMHNYSYVWLGRSGDLTPEQIADRFCDLLLHGLMK